MNITSKKIINILTIYALICMIIASFFDLQINKALFARGSFFSDLFKFIGEIPMIILFSASAYIFIRFRYYHSNKIFIAFIAILLFLFPLVSSFTTLSYFNIKNSFYSILIFLFYISIIYFIGRNIKNDENGEMLNLVIFTMISIIIIFLLFNIMKNIWGRMRFFPMLENNDFGKFTNWWQITNNSGADIYKSFPSGHTSAAASSLILIHIPEIFKNKTIQKYKYFFYFFPVIWIILVQISRIIDGAHFLSDVSFALLLVIFVINLVKFVLLKIFQKKI